MARRRMFSLDIVDSDAFLDMSLTAQALYFHLGMRADDDGVVDNVRSILRIVGASIDDANLLVTKKFVIPIDERLIVIKHWGINNYIQKDRYIKSKYSEQLSELSFDENGAYTGLENTFAEQRKTELTPARQKRLDAKNESDLPYSFDYKIKHYFSGKPCPICGCDMTNFKGSIRRPSIQHNTPISKGGKHELGNISVVCLSCNLSIQDNETGELNAQEVLKAWELVGNVSGMDTQDRLGKDRLGKDNTKDIGQNLFNKFWSAYPRKVNKQRAINAWKKIKPDEELCAVIIQAVEAHAKTSQWQDMKYIPHASTWLNGQQWEDELPEQKSREQIRDEWMNGGHK